VYRPSWLPGLSLAVDYYDIRIDRAIGALTAQNVVDLCAAGEAGYCDYVERLPDNTLVSVTLLSLNQNVLRNRGVDFEANLNVRLGAGDLGLRGLVSYLDTLATTDPFGNVDERAGVNGGEQFGTPRWQGSLGASYVIGGFTAFVQQRFISSGLYSNQYVVGGRAANSIDVNHVAGRTYTDLTLKQRVPTHGGEIEAYLTITNLWDTDPPPSPTRTGPPASILGTNPTLYDVLGRTYNIGLRARF
jgi:hypothetical protein